MQRRRSPWLLPALGAAGGAIGLTALTIRACRGEECILHPLAPAAVGTLLGGAVGYGAERLLRLSDR